MRWFPDLANAAFCETVGLRRKILERRFSSNSVARQGLEPSSAEFIAALAAGNNSHNIVQVGCGISTVALAVAAQATGGLLISIHTDESKQEIVRYHMTYLGLLTSVEFFIVSEPRNILLTKTNIDFAHFTGDPKDYIQLFDSLNLCYGAIVAADNAFNHASNAYIRHVRQQPGVESSTLPLARGVELTKLVSWEKFKSGRMLYSGLCEGAMKEREDGSHLVSCAWKETPTFPSLLGDVPSTNISNQAFEEASFGNFSIESPDETHTSYGPCTSKLSFQLSDTHEPQATSANPIVDVIFKSSPSCSNDSVIDIKKPCMESISTDDPVVNHDIANFGSDGVLDSPCSSGFKVHFRNNTTETEVMITGVNRDMLLSDITSAFSKMGISVKTANIETRDDLIEDVFYVTEAKSRAPLHPSQWKSVREKILGSIGKRCGTQSSKG